MLARNGKTYVRNTRRYCDNLRPLTALTFYLAVPSKDVKDFVLMWGLFQEYSSWGRRNLCEWCIQPGGKKFVRKIKGYKLSSLAGKKQPYLMLIAYLTVAWTICWIWCVCGWHCCSQRAVSLSKQKTSTKKSCASIND